MNAHIVETPNGKQIVLYQLTNPPYSAKGTDSVIVERKAPPESSIISMHHFVDDTKKRRGK